MSPQFNDNETTASVMVNII